MGGTRREQRALGGARPRTRASAWVHRAALLLCLPIASGCASGLRSLPESLFGSPEPRLPPEETIVAGLREALQVATERTVARTAREGGFRDDPYIRLRLPPSLDEMADALEASGLRPQVHLLELAMNRAAERSAREALPAFGDAVNELGFSDAAGILRGPEDAATRYFRARTEPSLRARLTPVVDVAIRQVGLVQAYDQLLERYALATGFHDPQLDLTDYVTQGTLDGLFRTLAGEERRIRQDPVARSSELLETVFGATNSG